MHPNFKRWLRELRNPNNKQAVGFLEYNGATCALGLYAKLQNIPTVVMEEEMSAYGYIAEQLRSEGIPVEGNCDAVLELDIIGLNDDANLTLPEIADELERAYYREVKHGTLVVQEMVVGSP